MENWSIAKVAHWLQEEIGVSLSVANQFRVQQVDGSVLASLKDEDLKSEFSDISFGYRKKIILGRDRYLSSLTNWVLWCLTMTGEKVSIRPVDPTQDIESLKERIRSHPDLGFYGVPLPDFALKKKGVGGCLPPDQKIMEHLESGDEIEVHFCKIKPLSPTLKSLEGLAALERPKNVHLHPHSPSLSSNQASTPSPSSSTPNTSRVSGSPKKSNTEKFDLDYEIITTTSSNTANNVVDDPTMEALLNLSCETYPPNGALFGHPYKITFTRSGALPLLP